MAFHLHQEVCHQLNSRGILYFPHPSTFFLWLYAVEGLALWQRWFGLWFSRANAACELENSVRWFSLRQPCFQGHCWCGRFSSKLCEPHLSAPLICMLLGKKRHMASSKVILKICLAVPSSLLLFLATSAEGIFPGVPLGNLKDGVLIQSCWKKLEWLSHWGQLEKTFKSVI